MCAGTPLALLMGVKSPRDILNNSSADWPVIRFAQRRDPFGWVALPPRCIARGASRIGISASASGEADRLEGASVWTNPFDASLCPTSFFFRRAGHA